MRHGTSSPDRSAGLPGTAAGGDDPRPRARLYIEADLKPGATVPLDKAQAHYLATVLRLAPGTAIALFNGHDGEVVAELDRLSKSGATAKVHAATRTQANSPDLWLLFAPIKRAGIDLIAQKATELGVSRLVPVTTRHTDTARVPTDRLRAIAIEAAEQSERLDVPEVDEARPIEKVMSDWPPDRRLLACIERLESPQLAAAAAATVRGPAALLIGPEGGWAPSELDLLRDLPFVTSVSLGPRILRAETAAIAALAVFLALTEAATPGPS